MTMSHQAEDETRATGCHNYYPFLVGVLKPVGTWPSYLAVSSLQKLTIGTQARFRRGQNDKLVKSAWIPLLV